MKELLGQEIAKRIKSDEIIGLGSGSTVELALKFIGDRIKTEGIRVYGVPTSQRTALLASKFGIKVLSPLSYAKISWAFDGADEVDRNLNMIKGKGAAMLNEKIIACLSSKLVILITQDKLVEKLGANNPIPVEIIPEACAYVQKELSALGASKVELREGAGKFGPVITEHNNLILDAWFSNIKTELETQIKSIVGIIESGLFIGYADEVLVAKADGTIETMSCR